ncbi:Ca2+-dependent phosphoinositide-specific phospholipase C, partial [Streptococcus suis]
NDPVGIDYGHLPFDSQFSDYNMRGLEIDIQNDPKGGAFYKRKINAFVHGMPVRSGIEALRRPGFKVLHIKDVDYQTNYYTFKDALTALKRWS